MNTQINRRYRAEAPSLLLLRTVLANAGRDLPPRVIKPQKDINEELALKLIERMKMEHRKSPPPVNWKAEVDLGGFVELPKEMAGTHA